MILNILKKDLKRKKTMNVILLIFVVLATMFVASSINNIITVMNGTEYYFEKARLGDYVVLTMGEDTVEKLDDFFTEDVSVKAYRMEKVIYASEDKFSKDGEPMKFHNTILLQCLEDAKMNFFDENNEVVSSVEKGKIYLTADAMKNNNLEIGDTIRIQHGNVDITLEVMGKLKDALLGSTFMGNTRVLLSKEDYELFEKDEILSAYYSGKIFYIDTDDEQALVEMLSEAEGIAFDANRSLIKMCYVMDMIVAGVLLVVSICLIIVAFVVLKFTITFTLAEEFREIGVMKAIGIKDRKIRGIYVVKYLVISFIGAVIGLFASIPFSRMMIKSVSENMVLENESGILLHVVSAIFIVLVIVGYAYFCTGRVKKYSPIDAIRSGQTGERFKKKTIFRIGKSHLDTTGYMAVNDIISSPKRYLTIILAFTICSLLVFMLVNTTETLQSDKLVTTFGKASDVYYVDVSRSMEIMAGDGNKQAVNELKNLEQTLSNNDISAIACVETQYKYKVEFDGNIYKLTCQQGINTKTTDYEYYEGSAPQNLHEIAITKQIADKLGAEIGDTIKITVGDKTDEYLVTAYFQSMNQMGEIIRLHEDVPTDLKNCASIMSFQFDFTDNPTQQIIDERVDKIKEIFKSDKVFNAADYTAYCVGVVDTMKSVEYLLLGITIVVVILVTVLMERSFISDEKSEIAILKAIGFKNRSIMAWHIKRFCMVGVIAVMLAVLMSVPMTKLCITPIFRMMGMSQVNYMINPIQICLIYPGIILLVTLLSAGFTSLYTRTINSSDTASIE